MKTRPFEAGDLVIHKYLGICTVKNIGFSVNVVVINGLGGKYSALAENITVIRRPRKGSKEARDIVAMLGRMFLSERRYEWRIERRDRLWKSETQILSDAYEQAKAMLDGEKK